MSGHWLASAQHTTARDNISQLYSNVLAAEENQFQLHSNHVCVADRLAQSFWLYDGKLHIVALQYLSSLRCQPLIFFAVKEHQCLLSQSGQVLQCCRVQSHHD